MPTTKQIRVIQFYKEYQDKHWYMPTYKEASENLWITTAWIYKTIKKFEKEWVISVIKKPRIIFNETDIENHKDLVVRVTELERVVKELIQYKEDIEIIHCNSSWKPIARDIHDYNY